MMIISIDLSPEQGFQCQHKQIETNIVNNQLAGDRPVGCVQSTAKKLNLGQLQTNLESSKMEGLNPGPADYYNPNPKHTRRNIVKKLKWEYDRILK